jgi:hypothetical protein
MNTKPILTKLLALVGKQRHGVYRFDSGKYTILWRSAIIHEDTEDLVVGLTKDLCPTCRGDGDIPGSWTYYPCVPCKATGFVDS